MKWRLVLVNPDIPKAAFYTIQREDYKVMPYKSECQMLMYNILRLSDPKDTLKMGKIGDAYGMWREEELPWFATELNFNASQTTPNTKNTKQPND
jgi:hypothetical protein